MQAQTPVEDVAFVQPKDPLQVQRRQHVTACGYISEWESYSLIGPERAIDPEGGAEAAVPITDDEKPGALSSMILKILSAYASLNLVSAQLPNFGSTL
eukprot:37515-Eustigmatos_ZCMA.PRE.1